MRNFIIYPFLFLSILMYSQEVKFGKITQEELEEKIHPIDSTADAAYLYKKRRTYFEYDPHKGFIVIDEYHERVKIYTKEGFDYATKKISYYDPESGSKERISDLKAYTFNLESGKIDKQKVASKDIFEEKISKYRTLKKISFPSVKEGSVIELKYKRIIPYWEIPSLVFQHNIPVNNLDYQVKIPEYFIFNKRSKGYYSIPVKEEKSSESIDYTTKERSSGNGLITSVKTTFTNNRHNYISNIYIIQKENIPAMKDNEPYSGHINNYRGGMEFELSGTRFPNSMYKDYSATWTMFVNKSINPLILVNN
ncbi:DUF3857 domain-containing protein [Tenacibaculum sp. TC6]|uniref:DUF3857 domain-containing protein n=1 Tax=Tenacibaculum sp. TC6 TaxID=3423223 RepID=UPI003D366A08